MQAHFERTLQAILSAFLCFFMHQILEAL